MQKLKEVYDIKKQLVTSDITELGDILKENSNIDTVEINPDNTIYLESNCGVDSIKDNLNEAAGRWLWVDNIISRMIFCTLPLSNNSCIVKI